MDMFNLVSASVYNNNNKSLSKLTVTEQEVPKYQAEQNPTYWIDSLKKEINKNLFARADSLVEKILSFTRIKLSNSQSLLLDGVETGVLLSDFAQQLRRNNSDVPDIYFTLLDSAAICPTLVLNHNAEVKEGGSCVLFKLWTSKAANAVHAGRCCLWVCVQFSKRWQPTSIKAETIFSFKTFVYKVYSCCA